MSTYIQSYLQKLEDESIQIIREAYALGKNPVMLYSIGKDSSVLLHLIRKAFMPGKVPFPLMHVDTGYKFREMIEFRDSFVEKIGAKLIVRKNESEEALAMGPQQAHTDSYVYYKKTQPLLEGLKEYGFDVIFGGARRDEEKSRAKERVFSFRNEFGVWDPKKQRPELWRLYNAELASGESIRVFPLSNWTELNVWQYIEQEGIEIVPLYFAESRKHVRRNGALIRLDEYTQALEGEDIIEANSRYRTLGCAPSTGAVLSEARSVAEIIEELKGARTSERQNRSIDRGSPFSLESKKKEGYF